MKHISEFQEHEAFIYFSPIMHLCEQTLKVGDTHATRAGAAAHRPVSLKNQFQYDLSDFTWFFI